MDMEFSVDMEEKDRVQELVNGDRKSVRILEIIKKIILICTLGGTFISIVLKIAVPRPNWTPYIITRGDVLVMDYETIFWDGGAILVVGLTIYFLVYVFGKKVESINVSARVCEQLILQDDELIYLYRVEFESSEDSREVYKIPLMLNSITYDEKTHKMKFDGMISASGIGLEEGENEMTFEEPQQGSCIIYDYFSPRLKTTLEEEGHVIKQA